MGRRVDFSPIETCGQLARNQGHFPSRKSLRTAILLKVFPRRFDQVLRGVLCKSVPTFVTASISSDTTLSRVGPEVLNPSKFTIGMERVSGDETLVSISVLVILTLIKKGYALCADFCYVVGGIPSVFKVLLLTTKQIANKQERFPWTC